MMDKYSIVERIYTKKTINRIKRKAKLMGTKYSIDINKLLLSHLLISIFILLIIIIINKEKFILALILSLTYFIVAEYFYFDIRLKKRERILENDSIFYFQILALTLESGNNLKNAIELTSKNMDNDLSIEFKKVIDDMALGKNLSESLDDLKQRIPSDTINNIILNLQESNIYGNNMIESLHTQLDYLNDKLLLGVKERINKMPIKISVTSVFLFIPLILIILLAPIIMTLINS